MTRITKEILLSIFVGLLLLWVTGLISTDDLKGGNLIFLLLLTGIVTGLGSIEKEVAEIRNMLDTMSNKDDLQG